MWTKQFTSEGLAYFYNSSLNQSVWHPPDNGVVHVAPFATYPVNNNCTQMIHNSIVDQAASAPVPQLNHMEHTQNYAASSIGQNSDDTVGVKKVNTNIAKRFKVNKETPREDNLSSNSLGSSYLRQKSELEAMRGCKSDDSGKWLVR